MRPRIGSVVIFILLILTLKNPSMAAAKASLKLFPSSLTVAKDSTLTVSVLLSTGGESINFVTANLDFPKDKIAVESFDETGTFITLWPEKTYNNDLGRINLAGGLYNPGVNGADLKVIGLRFKTRGNVGDIATVAFRASSEVYRLNDTTDILGTKTNGTYTIQTTGTTTIPQPTSNTIGTLTPTPQVNLTPTSIAATTATLESTSELPKSGSSVVTGVILTLGFTILTVGFLVARNLSI